MPETRLKLNPSSVDFQMPSLEAAKIQFSQSSETEILKPWLLLGINPEFVNVRPASLETNIREYSYHLVAYTIALSVG